MRPISGFDKHLSMIIRANFGDFLQKRTFKPQRQRTNSCVRVSIKCVHGARQRCSRCAVANGAPVTLYETSLRCYDAVGDLAALLRRPYCAHVTTPNNSAHFEHAQSARRGMETEETPRRPIVMHLRARRPQCAHHGVLHFLGRRTVSVRTQPLCCSPLIAVE